MYVRFALTLTFAALAIGGGCVCDPGPGPDPTDIELGNTAVVVAVNPAINTINTASVPAPGSQRSGVAVSLGAQRTATSSAAGIAVLGGLDAGTYPLNVGGGSVQVTVVDRELREMAVAQSGSTAAIMADVRYPFATMQVIEIDAGLPVAQVNAALNGSNRIVLVRGGTYTGNILFNGSNVTLFGEGAAGGRVTINGDVTVNGSNNRIRGARITGALAVDGSGFGLTFSKVAGALTVTGSDTVLLENSVCGTTTISGGNLTVLGNQGIAPLGAPDGGCT